MKIGQSKSAGTKEFIRIAERHIQAHNYEQAMNELIAAQRIDPDNMYIHAIVERIHRLAAEESNGGRFLALTVGTEFASGIKDSDSGAPAGEDVENIIRRLTSKASELVRRGAYETAFDSLMNAYLLDPVSPSLMDSERTLLPAIEMMRKRGTIKEGSQRFNSFGTLPPSGRRPDGGSLSSDEARRLEDLKRQKELERQESERAKWREASRAPRILENPLVPEPPQQDEDQPAPSSEPQKELTGFFAKLRHGRLLG